MSIGMCFEAEQIKTLQKIVREYPLMIEEINKLKLENEKLTNMIKELVVKKEEILKIKDNLDDDIFGIYSID